MHDQIEVTKRDAVVQQSAILMQYYGEFSYFPVKAMLIEEGMNLETVNNNTMFQLLYKIIIRELKKNNSIVRHFRTEMIDKLPEKWRIFKNIITTARIEELKSIKIIRKNKKYDISELKQTYFGRKIINEFSFKSKKLLTTTEWNSVKTHLTKLNLEFPEEIEPTTTEKFFGD